eukprot:m.134765 g.134765  ORF g.134765 m.134765 type:complete len:104 (+) comp15979_c0_seq1:43-354(+)
MTMLSVSYWINDWKLWQIQVLGIGFLMVLAQIVEKKAAMRGCNRNPLPAWFDRFLRVAFLSIFLGPTCWALDSLIGFPFLTVVLAVRRWLARQRLAPISPCPY